MVPGSKLGQVLPGGHKRTVSGGGSAVHVVGAAVPVNVGAAAGGAHGSITLLGLGHIHQLGLLGHKRAVSGGGSTVHVVGAAVPANVRAAAGRAHGSITLLGLGHLHQLGLLGPPV